MYLRSLRRLVPRYIAWCLGLLATSWWQVVHAESAALQFKTDTSDAIPLGHITIFLLVVAALLFVLLALVKNKRLSGQLNRFNKPGRWLNWLPVSADDSLIRILDSKRITPKTSLHVVEWEGGKVLLAVNDQNVVRVGEVPVAGAFGSADMTSTTELVS